MEAKTINWTAPMLKRFKAAYSKVEKTHKRTDTFSFEGNLFVLGYAKYLIEYLDSVL